jgi:serine phosphatase RsbU (regulator of sigma subunit)
VNRAFEALTGLRASDIIGRTAREVLPGLEPAWIETYAEVALQGMDVHFENYSASLGRHYEVVAFSSSPGKFATLFTDISERKAQEELLNRTAAEMQAAYLREHEMAEYLQKALLPEIRQVPGFEVDVIYRSASELAQVGGDFYDLVPLPGGRAMIVVGDVCGKGVAAAKRMAAVRLTLRALAADDLCAGKWLTEANRRLAAVDAKGDFVTVALIVLDPAGGRLEYSLAGHPPPYLVSSGGVRLLEGAVGVPVGVFTDSAYTTGEERLSPGDVLILYTDGLSEARREYDLFGTTALPAEAETLLLRPFAGEAARLMEAATTFSQGNLRDDTVVMLLKVS